ncbi:MAG: DUF3325 family protein, partial [Reyranella sp.]
MLSPSSASPPGAGRWRWRGCEARRGVVIATLLIALTLATYLGFALLALSQDRHWQRAGGGMACPPRLVRPLRVVGSFLLFAALVLALVR